MDIREAVALYEAGHTIAEVAATLHVAPRTVVRNFDKAGIPRRRPGPPPREVPVAEIRRLRDEGLTMSEVAAAVGTTVNIARKRHRRTQVSGDSRAAIPSKMENSKLGRWHAGFIDALTHRPVIAVHHAVALYLGREPTDAELSAAQRAAHRLADQYQLRIAHVSSGRVTSSGTPVIAREDRHITDEQLVRAARKRLPKLRAQPPSPIVDQLIDDLASTPGGAATAARALAAEDLDDRRSAQLRRLVDRLATDLDRLRPNYDPSCGGDGCSSPHV